MWHGDRGAIPPPSLSARFLSPSAAYAPNRSVRDVIHNSELSQASVSVDSSLLTGADSRPQTTHNQHFHASFVTTIASKWGLTALDATLAPFHPLNLFKCNTYKNHGGGEGTARPATSSISVLSSLAHLSLLIFSGLACAFAPPLAQTQETATMAEARSLLDKGRTSDAEHAVSSFLKEHPDSAEAHFLHGYILFKEVQSAADGNAEALPPRSQPSGQPTADVNLNSNFQDAAVKASLAEFTEGAKYHTPGPFDLKIVALDYVLLGDYADADKWLTRSVQGNPQDEQAWYYLGRTKYNENRFEEAVQAFQQCLKFDPQSVKVEDNLGLAYAGLGRTEDAIAAYKTAMAWQEKAPTKDAGPYIDVGDLLLDQDRTEEALPYLREAIEISPMNSKAHELMGKAYTRLDQFPLAQAELEKAVSLAPQIASLHCMLGPVYRKQGSAEKAKAEFDRCSAMTQPSSASGKTHP
jgi:tetratricopeptide (TPR) repeat protein